MNHSENPTLPKHSNIKPLMVKTRTERKTVMGTEVLLCLCAPVFDSIQHGDRVSAAGKNSDCVSLYVATDVKHLCRSSEKPKVTPGSAFD